MTERYIKKYNDYKDLSKERELYLFNNIENPIYREEIVKSHLKMVIRIANRYSSLGNSFKDDLIQEGTVGLLEAIDAFDVSFRNRFSTFASFRILNSIRSFLRKISFINYFPEKKIHKIFKLNNLIADINKQNLSIPPITELAIFLKSSEKETQEIYDFIFSGFQKRLQEEVETKSLRNKIDHSVLTKEIQSILNQFEEIDKKIIHLRYSENKTWREISKFVGLSHEGCRKRHGKIVKILKIQISPEYLVFA